MATDRARHLRLAADGRGRLRLDLAALAAVLALGACDGDLDPVRGAGAPSVEPPLSSPIEPSDLGDVDVTFTVRSDQDLIPISPWIYGMNGQHDLAPGYPTLLRRADMRWSAYNWENNASNAGLGFHYQNDSGLAESDAPGAALIPALSAAEVARCAAVVSVPILDHVAADKLGDGDVRESGQDFLLTRFLANMPRNPSGPRAEPDLDDRTVYQDDMVAWVRAGFEGTDVFFTLDSAPDLWPRFHPELHPEPVLYDEIVDRNVRWAAAIKSAWPGAPVIGLGADGWSGWEWLNDQANQPAPDGAGKGALLDYWLRRLREAEASEGRRLVDYVDLHWHPEATGGGVRVLEHDTSPEVVAARLQAPRSLWDPSFVEASWITEVATHGAAIRWIPSVLERIARGYPGTGLAILEWSFGADDHISGGLATADALGVFGRYGIGLAAHGGAATGTYAAAAFAAFRNYDGAGSGFGDTSLTAVTTDVERTSIHASLDFANKARIVVIAINKAEAPLTAGLRLAHPTLYSRAQTWILTDGAPELRPGASVDAAGTNAFRLELAPRSLSVVSFAPDALAPSTNRR